MTHPSRKWRLGLHEANITQRNNTYLQNYSSVVMLGSSQLTFESGRYTQNFNACLFPLIKES